MKEVSGGPHRESFIVHELTAGEMAAWYVTDSLDYAYPAHAPVPAFQEVGPSENLALEAKPQPKGTLYRSTGEAWSAAPEPAPWRHKLRRAISTIALAGTILGGTVVTHNLSDDTPSRASTVATAERFAQPDTPLAENPTDATTAISSADPSGVMRSEHQQFLRRERIAQEHGLTVFDGSAARFAILHGNLTTEQQFKTVDGFVRQYGVGTGLLTEAIDTAIPPRPESFQNPALPEILAGIVGDLSSIPKELVAQAGIEHIYFGAIPQEANLNVLARTNALGPATDRRITINLEAPQQNMETSVINHEIWHNIDARRFMRIPPYAKKDPVFAAAVGKPAYDQPATYEHGGTPVDDRYISLEKYSLIVDEQSLIVTANRRSSDCPEIADQAASVINKAGARTIFPTLYASKSAIEHKAEFGGIITAGDRDGMRARYSMLISPHLPLLRAGTMLELSRLGDVNPALRDYFIDVAYKQEPFDPAQKLRSFCAAQPG